MKGSEKNPFTNERRGENSETGSLRYPEKIRSTDSFCLALFFVFIVVQVSIFAYGAVFGDIQRIFHNYDCYGNVCDRKINSKVINHPLSGIDTTEKRFIFHTQPNYWKSSIRLCVKECPSVTIYRVKDIVAYMNGRNVSLCQYDVPPGTYKEPEYVSNEVPSCPPLPIMKQTSLSGFCVFASESFTQELSNSVAGINGIRSVWEAVMRDLLSVRAKVFILTGLAILLSLVFFCCIRFLPNFFHNFILVFSTIFLLASTVVLWYAFHYVNTRLSLQSEKGILSVQSLNEITLFTGALVISLISLLLIVVICMSVRPVQALAGVIQLCATCIDKMKSVLLLPVLSTICLLIYFYFWMDSLANVVTIAVIRYQPITDCILYVTHSFVPFLFVFHLISLLWMVDFIVGCQQFIISKMVMEWYLMREQTSSSFFQVIHSCLRLMRRHLGSVALSSFPLLPSRFLHFFVLLARASQACCRRTTPKNTELRIRQENSCIVSCMYATFLSSNRAVFIFCAKESRSYFQAMIKVHSVMQGRIPQSVETLNALLNFIFFMSKCATCTTILLLAVLLFMADGNIYFSSFPMIMSALMAFYISHAILCVCENIIDALLLCRCLQICQYGGDSVDRSLTRENMNNGTFQQQLEMVLQNACLLLVSDEERPGASSNVQNSHVELTCLKTDEEKQSHPATALV